MTTAELFRALQDAANAAGVDAALQTFQAQVTGSQWIPVGRENNRGTIEASADPGRSIVERVTNGIDAILEAEHESHHQIPDCRSPREAATAWLNVPEDGLSGMTPQQRRTLAQRVSIRVADGDGRSARIVDVRDRGSGIRPSDMAGTILSLNATNKWRKHHLAGTYGQGGSSTFAVSRYTLIASRYDLDAQLGFTIVKFLDLPADEFKTGHYVYLALGGEVLTADVPLADFPTGTLVRHFGYDLTNYGSPVGPKSVYGLLNQILFDPVMPVWLESQVHGYRRVIKGSRNALNGAVDEGDEQRRGPTLAHNVKLFYVSLGEFGRAGIEYWVLERPSADNKRPTEAFVNPRRPIVFTLNGQNHAELPISIVRKDAELPYLSQRLICHVDCNSLSADAKRALFVSNREDARRGLVYDMIQGELLKVLRSDDELTRLNNEARDQGLRERDESAAREMRQEVARLLRLQGFNVGDAVAPTPGGDDTRSNPPRHPRGPRPTPEPITPHEPPTFIKILWDDEREIPFHPEQRRYVRIETDASSTYHNARDNRLSHINIIAEGQGVAVCGSTPLQGGRMRAIFEASREAAPGTTGTLRVELLRPGLPILSDSRTFTIVQRPPTQPARTRVALPPFEVRAVDPSDPRWNELGWPEDQGTIASSSENEDGTHVIYYSTAYPKYAGRRQSLEQRDPALATSFTRRYEIWLAVHSLMLVQDERGTDSASDADTADAEDRERQERCRVATLASLVASREVLARSGAPDDE